MNKLHIPELDLDQDMKTLLASQEVVEKLEQCVMNWQTQITIVLKEQEQKKPQVCSKKTLQIYKYNKKFFFLMEKHVPTKYTNVQFSVTVIYRVSYLLHSTTLFITPQGPGPMAELEFWRERATVLSGLCEQLKLPVVKKILEVMSQADLDPMQNLNETITELNLYQVEAMQNVRVLSTVKRYLKVS